MKNRFILAVASLLLNASLSLAQAPEELPPPTPASPSVATMTTTTHTPLTSFFLPMVSRPLGTAPLGVNGDYLFTFVRGLNLPPLVTTALPGTPRTSAGAHGAFSTSTLFGSNWVDGDSRSGFRFGLGYW